MNVLDRVSKNKQPVAKEMLTGIMYAPTQKEAEDKKKAFQSWAEAQGLTSAGKALDEDWDRMVTYYSYPKDHWVHLRTTNIVESPFAAVRLRTSGGGDAVSEAQCTGVAQEGGAGSAVCGWSKGLRAGNRSNRGDSRLIFLHTFWCNLTR
jgi:transposase-like protein